MMDVVQVRSCSAQLTVRAAADGRNKPEERVPERTARTRSLAKQTVQYNGEKVVFSRPKERVLVKGQ